MWHNALKPASWSRKAQPVCERGSQRARRRCIGVGFVLCGPISNKDRPEHHDCSSGDEGRKKDWTGSAPDNIHAHSQEPRARNQSTEASIPPKG